MPAPGARLHADAGEGDSARERADRRARGVPLEKRGLTVHNGGVESAVISSEIKQLETELEELRARVDEDASSFASLQGEIESLKQRLGETQDAVRRQEAELDEKRAQLAEAQRLERLASYDQDLAMYREARDCVEHAADRFLAEVEAYDAEVL